MTIDIRVSDFYQQGAALGNLRKLTYLSRNGMERRGLGSSGNLNNNWP
ncbi:MAG: hypothetical protein KDD19_04740 [Phaeodactylibacter sp.]|nr:hypothetical protein [Phaeodactylibacter sp.]MCB9048484.1 hypothetical protein [Lewinellaceae bacterium]